jgi:hypothetical protein
MDGHREQDRERPIRALTGPIAMRHQVSRGRFANTRRAPACAGVRSNLAATPAADGAIEAAAARSAIQQPEATSGATAAIRAQRGALLSGGGRSSPSSASHLGVAVLEPRSGAQVGCMIRSWPPSTLRYAKEHPVCASRALGCDSVLVHVLARPRPVGSTGAMERVPSSPSARQVVRSQCGLRPNGPE